MISLIRVRTATAVKIKYRGVEKKAKDRELLMAKRLYLNDATKKIPFNSAFWKLAKDQLKAESYGKCAYCEADTDAVAHGDVEHYRPKSEYWWQAYTYDNYLFACQICNQTYKSDNFPIRGIKFPEPVVLGTYIDSDIDSLCGMISPDPLATILDYKLQKYIDAHLAEEALLLNPYFDDPALVIAYEADDIKQEVTIVPLTPAKQVYVKAMEDFYGLNRLELKNLRYAVFNKFKTFKRVLPMITDAAMRTEAQNRINEMLHSKHTFAGMSRYFDAIL